MISQLTIATDDQIEQLRRHAVNDVTVEIARDGVRLTWEQVKDLGDEVIDWMGARLGLNKRKDADGIAFTAPKHYASEEARSAGIEVSDEAYGYTFAAWLAAAGRTDSASEHDLRAAWRAGEDPSEYAVEVRS